MSFLRDLRSDLVEKRMWPLALLLVAALVAVPLVLAKSPKTGSSAAPAEPLPAPSASAGTSTTGVPAVSIVETPNGGAALRGHAKDPFKQQHVPPKPSTSTGGTTKPSGTSGSGGGSSGGSSGGAPAHSKHLTVYVTASVDVRFGRAGSPLRSIKDVPRLTPLPSASNPIVIFLGMRSDLKTAVFMVSSDVHVQGDGRCVPSKKQCEGIELKQGDTALLDVAGSDGAVHQYELDLAKVTLSSTTSKAKAKTAYARVSRSGRRLLRRRAATSAVASGLRYSRRKGFLSPVDSTFLSSVGALSAHASDRPQAVADGRLQGWVAPAP